MSFNARVKGTVGVVAAVLMGCPGFIDDGGGGGGGGGGFGISNFNSGFVFLRAADRNVYVSDASSSYTDVSQLTRNGNNKHVSLSKNGQQVAFIHEDGASTVLQTALLSGSEPSTVLTSDGTRSKFQSPVFSPDGTQLAFSFEQGGASYLGLVNTDGQSFQSFGTGTLSYTSPSFIDSGTVLVAAGSLATGYNQIEKVELASGTAQNVVSTLGNEATAIRNRLVVSPDGTRAAFDGVIASGVTRIFVIDLGTGAVTQLTDYADEPNANDTFPTWVSNTEIGYSSDAYGNDQVYVISATAQKANGQLKLPSAVQPWFGPN